MDRKNLKKLSVTAMFSAIAFIITFAFRFNVSFLTFDFKVAIISILAFLYGPLYGIASSAVVTFLEYISVSDTGIYGLIMNFLATGGFALVCGVTYKFKRSFSGAILSVILSTIIVTALMLAGNIVITPIYMNVPVEAVYEMIPTLLLPFNICKGIINGALLLIIYKPLTAPLKKSGLINVNDTAKYTISKKTVLLIIFSALAIVLAVLYLLLIMKGNFQIF
ncbi:MAG: ECF transporter S component [Acutalibacteraceae bacterium]